MIGQGVVQDWATHRIGHEFTARYGLDHARTLTLVQPALLRETLPEKQARLERMGARVFGLTGEGEQLARGTIVALEAFYRALGLPTRAGANKEKVLAYMQHDKKACGDHITVIKCPGLGCWRADKIPMTELPALLGIKENED